MIIREPMRNALTMSCVTTMPRRAAARSDAPSTTLGHDRIEPGGRLITEEQLGIKRQRSREAHALLHPAADLRGLEMLRSR